MKQFNVYQHLDSKGQCIYVGRTVNMVSRQGQHRSKSPHWQYVDKILCATCLSKTEMIIYEQYYINKLNPKYNKADKREDNVEGIQGVLDLAFKLWQTDIKKYTAQLCVNNKSLDTQLAIIQAWENYSVDAEGEVLHYKQQNKNKVYHSLWQDYGEARCMCCNRDMGGAYEGLKQLYLQKGTPWTKYETKEFNCTKARKNLYKHTFNREKPTVKNTVLLCRTCFEDTPPPVDSTLFWTWFLHKASHTFRGINNYEKDRNLNIILKTYPTQESIQKVCESLSTSEKIYTLWGSVLMSLNKNIKENPLFLQQIKKEQGGEINEKN